jgi:hypothetical protein
MTKIRNILAIGFIMIFGGCSYSSPNAEALYKTYLTACPLNFKVTTYNLKYHGEIKAGSSIYHLLGYSYVWEVYPGNCRGNGQILVFNGKQQFIGYFQVFGYPEVTIKGKILYLYFPDETEQNQRTYYDFSEGLPETDMNDFGFSYVTKDKILEYRKQ